MESEEEKWEKLDAEFDHFVVDMKPFVLKLPHRSGKIGFEIRCFLGFEIFLLCSPGWTGVHYAAQDSLQHTALVLGL